MNLGNCVLRPVSGAETVTTRFEVPLENIGSGTSFKAACTVRSRAVGLPSPRSLPPLFGMSFSRTGSGRNCLSLRSFLKKGRNVAVPETTERGFTPSTPAVRAPLLPRTRAHTAVRKAGSATRLNRSSKRRPKLAIAHWCSLVWILSTRDSAS